MGVQERVTRNIRVIMAMRQIEGDQPIAEILGVGPTAISKKRRGKLKWTLEDVELIAEAWRIAPGVLIGDVSTFMDPALAATGTEGSRNIYEKKPGYSGLLSGLIGSSSQASALDLEYTGATVVPINRARERRQAQQEAARAVSQSENRLNGCSYG